MGRRRKKSTSDELAIAVLFLLGLVINLIIRILVFAFDVITFFTSSYKAKSGVGFFKMYFNKGYYGEFLFYRKAIRVFGKENVFTNIYLDNVNTETTEIDVLAVSEKGVYVFEVKNYSGYIYGSERDKHWTQVLNKWTKNKFYNPLRQNYAHSKAVENYLEISNDSVIPVIVFSNNSKLSKINVGVNQKVFQYNEAMKFVRRNEKNSDNVFSTDENKEFLIKLFDKCNMSEDVKNKHIEDVKRLQSDSI